MVKRNREPMGTAMESAETLPRTNNQALIGRVLECLQGLDEWQGAETLADYIACHTAIKLEIEKRIAVAAERISKGET
jgi:hypothetical protein